MSLLSTSFCIFIHLCKAPLLLPTLPFYILTEIKCPWRKNLFLSLLFHFIVTEMKKDTANANAMLIVEIENMHATRNDMLISILKIILLLTISSYKL